MCRVLTIFLVVAVVYFAVLIVGAATRSECKYNAPAPKETPCR
jgi:hypothetical protein